jgi:hypothetical protein
MNTYEATPCSQSQIRQDHHLRRRRKALLRHFGIVRGCPLGTVRDRCEWQVGGTAGEHDDARTGSDGCQLDRRVRPVLGDHCLVGKTPEGSRRPDRTTDVRLDASVVSGRVHA